MPFIQWYPGHIAKAERKLQEQTALVDVILEIIDARIPLSSSYFGIEKLTRNKPRLLVMNKADLADPELNSKWRDYMADKTGLKVVLTNSNSSKDISTLIKTAIELGKPEIEKLVAKGRMPRPVRAMAIGMPNVGKSSIINKLVKTSKAKVGPKAGVTRAAQWVRINPKLEFMDTPGIIPMKLENQENAVKLAVVNSISENAYDYVEIAQELVNMLYERYPYLLEKHYKLEEMNEPPSLADIARSRKWLLPGGELDINRCASIVLSDFRNGRIGRITLESVPEE